MDAEERLSRIRSIIRETEKQMDDPNCDQLPLLRSAFVEIIMAVGPQGSGVRRTRDVRGKRKRSPKTPHEK